MTLTWDNYAAGKPLGIEILSSDDYIDGYNHMHVTGEVKNQGTINANFTKVFSTFYDSNGTVVGTAYSYTEPTHLAPNETATFDVELIYTQQVMKVSNYSLASESSQYALIPELSSLLIWLTALTILAGTIFCCRRLLDYKKNKRPKEDSVKL